jgi:hypothetical protein
MKRTTIALSDAQHAALEAYCKAEQKRRGSRVALARGAIELITQRLRRLGYLEEVDHGA